MRDSKSSKPKSSTVQNGSTSNHEEGASAKKLKQARLPFKVIDLGTSPVDSKARTATTASKERNTVTLDIGLKNGLNKEIVTDGKKRKLSYDEVEVNNCSTIEASDNFTKENVLVGTAKKKKVNVCNSEKASDIIVSLLDENSNEDGGPTAIIDSTVRGQFLKTPENVSKGKQKGAGTPQTSGEKKDKSCGASKLQIKLPICSGKKNKRRKSKLHQLTQNIPMNCSYNSCADSSDDIEEVSKEFNPQKRKKLNIEDNERNMKETNFGKQEVETIDLESEPEVDEEKSILQTENGEITSLTKTEKLGSENEELIESRDAKDECKGKESQYKAVSTSSKSVENKEKAKSPEKDDILNKICDPSDEIKNDKEDLNESIQSDNDNEADDETDNLAGKTVNISNDIGEDSKLKHNNNLESSKDTNNGSSAKNLTPKQIKLMEQRRKAREEKERRLQEEKKRKQLEKEEKEIAKKREREEKEEQRRKDREEKEEIKRKEREEKERKRLAEVEAKNEEKRKKNEAKEEELRKREEERKRKELQKEEEELKKKKAAQAFTKFFVTKALTNAQNKNVEESNTENGNKLLAFRPFQIKGDMKLAPICRRTFTTEEKTRLDDILDYQNQIQAEAIDEVKKDILCRKPFCKTQLYLSELQSGKILPGKWIRSSSESSDDIILVDDELERVGQVIVEETPAYIREQMRVKFYKFHDNRRPPYYGTWRKKSLIVKPRKPFAQDKKFFDYEIDSDDEWEEEEPGESLEDGSDDDKEKESEDDDYEVDNEWFVPHGHLSEEEIQNEDEFGTGDDNTREAQKAKLIILQQEFAQAMKKKTEKIKPRLIGCIWVDENGNQPPECAKILWDTLEKKGMLCIEPPLLEEIESDRSAEPLSPSASNGAAEKTTTDKLKHITLSDNMVKDLIRLIHGNNHSKNFLINEFIAYVEKTEDSVKNGDLRKPQKSLIRDKIEEIAEWQVVNATASSIQDMEQNNDNTANITKKKKKCKRRLCWVVKQELLDKMNLSSLKLHNAWKYTLPPKFVKEDKGVKTEESLTQLTVKNISNSETVTEEDSKGKKATTQITKFTKVLTAEEKAKKLQNVSSSSNHLTNPSIDSSVAETKANTSITCQSLKEKKRVPLLMSVARGQQISTPTKNKLISQFLKQSDKNTLKTPTSTTSVSPKTVLCPNVDDEVVILD